MEQSKPGSGFPGRQFRPVLGISSIHFATMSHLKNENDQFIVMDFIDDPVVTDANPVLSFAPFELDASLWTRF